MSGRLAGKVAIVTGGSRGQGPAEARRFVAEGARVLVADVVDDEGKLLADELGDAARYVHLDVTEEDEWTAAVAAAEGEFGSVDVLVNNAGILTFGLIDGLSTADLRRILDVNLLGTVFGMRAVIPAMRRAGGGSIINISSTEGLGGTPGYGAYTASKFAVRGVTKVAALELGHEGIRVNSVHPGAIDTAMVRSQGVDDDGMKALGKMVRGLKRVGSADEVAALVTFLASDESSYCTGAEFVVDGGATSSAGF